MIDEITTFLFYLNRGKKEPVLRKRVCFEKTIDKFSPKLRGLQVASHEFAPSWKPLAADKPSGVQSVIVVMQ